MVAVKITHLVGIGIALGLVQAVPINSSLSNNGRLLNKAICTTPLCVISAAGILNDMDPTVDPCEDFNKFACGGYFDKNDIPAGETSIGMLDSMDKSTNRVLRSIVDVSLGKAPKAAPGDVASQNNLKKLQDFFSSCMDETAILRAGRKPLADEVQKIANTLPASSVAPADKTALSKLLGQFSGLYLEYTGIFNIYVRQDTDDHLTNVLGVNVQGLTLQTYDDYDDEKLVQLLTDTIAAMFQVILGDEDIANRTQPLTPQDVKQEWVDAAKEVISFETQLKGVKARSRNIPGPRAESPQTVEQLNALTPSINWSVLLQEALPAGIKNTRPIIIKSSPAFFTEVDALLQKTSSRTLQLYYSWVLIHNLASQLSPPYKQPKAALDKLLSYFPTNDKVERLSTCIQAVNDNLGHMVGHYFILQVFPGNSRKEAMAIVDNLLVSYEKTFPTLAWLDKTTRDGAVKKLKGIAKLVGYSTQTPDVVSAKSLDEYYKDYAVDSKDYIGNQYRHVAWTAAVGFNELPKPVNKDRMRMVPATVNAYYTPKTNTIGFPAGILQMPLFSVENPEYINYGSMGVLGGHEIGHAFDDSGRHFDAIGRFENWWTNATSKAFEEKSQCFVDQYGNFTIKGPNNEDHNLNGLQTLGENLADNGGVKMAFRIWQSRLKSDPSGRKYNNFKLPGLDNYTPEQLFFISYGRLWCSKETPEWAIEMLNAIRHSPNQWRIKGVVQNSPDFAKAFKCPAGSPMNPVKKCEMW